MQSQREEKRFKSLSLKEGFRFGYYPTYADILADLGVDGEKKVVGLVNNQLSAHVTATQARDQFTTDLERVTGFPFLTKEVAGKGKNIGKTRTVAAESEADYVARFRKAIVDEEVKTFSPAADLGKKSESKPGENDGEVDIADSLSTLATDVPTAQTLETWLQTLASLRYYPLDARVTERVSKEKGLPKYATEGAIKIAGQGQSRIEHFRKQFAKRGVGLADIVLVNLDAIAAAATLLKAGQPYDKTTIATDAPALKVLAEAIVANEAAENEAKYQ